MLNKPLLNRKLECSNIALLGSGCSFIF